MARASDVEGHTDNLPTGSLEQASFYARRSLKPQTSVACASLAWCKVALLRPVRVDKGARLGLLSHNAHRYSCETGCHEQNDYADQVTTV